MVVEIENDNVSRIFPLSEESERVQWMPGVSVLLSDTDITKDFNREAMLADKIRPLLAETKIVDYIASDMNVVIMQKKWVVFLLLLIALLHIFFLIASLVKIILMFLFAMVIAFVVLPNYLWL